jgi:hypothetical protein
MVIFRSKKRFAARLHFAITFIVRVSLLIAIISSIVQGNWGALFLALLTLILTFLPALIRRNWKITLPHEFEIIIVLFIFSSLFLGEFNDFYQKFWWWDIFHHSFGSLALGFIGFVILYTLFEEKIVYAKPITISIFSFCFALSIGAIWEIFEFAMDSFFNWGMQASGLVDTMWDLIIDSLSAIFTSFIGYLYLKGGKVRIFNRLIVLFIKENPQFFKGNKKQ